MTRWREAWWRWLAARGYAARPDEKRPHMLSVEATNRCNLNCPFCLVGMQNSPSGTAHTAMPRPLGEMGLDSYARLIRDAKAFGIDDVRLHFQGEPLLNKHLPEMARMTRALNLPVQIYTNGMLLSEARLTALLDAGVTAIRFSVDGATPATYAVNRVGGDFNVVFANMRCTAEAVRARGMSTRVIWQFIVMRNNEHELEQARGMARELGVEFFAKPFATSVPDLVPVAPEHRRRMTPKPCTDIYSAIFVYWNGDVVVCCYDQDGENVIGNVGSDSLQRIWDSPRARRLRRRIDAAVRAPEGEPPMCRRCLKWSHHPWQTSDGLVRWDPVDGAGEVEET